MKVLITGVAGQVGSHVADKLLARGDLVFGIDNFATGRKIHLPQSTGFHFEEGSIADKRTIDKIFKLFKPDAVVHAAASYKDPENWVEDSETNARGGINLIKSSSSHEVKRFIYFQTALIYGVKPLTNPIELEHPRRVNNSSYSISKGVCEDYLNLSKLSYVVFRLANVIGDRCVSGPLPIFYQRLIDGKQCFVTPARRDFVYVGDLVGAVLKAIDGLGKGAYHFSSGKDFAIRELYDLVASELNFEQIPEPEIRPIAEDEAPSILLNPTRTFKDFGELKFTSLQETVSKAIDYYKIYGTEGEFTHLKNDK
jgi:nucleoside-diphosphate-sugar epimerase